MKPSGHAVDLCFEFRHDTMKFERNFNLQDRHAYAYASSRSIARVHTSGRRCMRRGRGLTLAMA